MNRCLAITKLDRQCKNNKKSKLFCTTHIKSPPSIIFLDGGELFGHRINYTNEAHYLATLQQYTDKYNAIAIKKKTEEEAEKQAKYLEESKHCHICFTSLDNPDELIHCSRTSDKFPHFICEHCLLGHIQSLMSDGIGSLDCCMNSSEKCSGCYNNNDIQRAIQHLDEDAAHMDKATFSTKWNEHVIASDVTRLASICDNYQICPLCCKWGCIFEVPPGADKSAFFIKCGSCNEQWCNLCKRTAHPGNTCYSLSFKPNEDSETRTTFINKMLQDIVNRTLTHSCSNCGCIYIKEEGCNLMTCPKCNGLSCYICNAKLYIHNNNKYWHFSGHALAAPGAQCPLWNNKAGDGKANQGNTDYNKEKIERELALFLTENKNNKDNYKLIQQCIKQLWSKDKDFSSMVKKLCPINARDYLLERMLLLN